jgi:hypothetical protein
MARSLRCPRCSTIVTVQEGQTPVCPSCGFGGPVAAIPTAPAASATAAPAGFDMLPPAPAPAPFTPFSPAQAQRRTSTPAVASLVLGIVALLFCWIPFAGLAAAIVAVVLGAIGINEANKDPARVAGKGMAIAGLVLGIIAGVFGLLLLTLFAAFAHAFGKYA